MSFIAIDFEASCLPQFGRSFPVEVGIASPLGWSKSWLICPHADWADWQWSRQAEAVHGISRERLEREGLEPARVVELLRAAVGTSELIADSRFDNDWSRTLFAAAGDPHSPPVHCLTDLPAFHEIDASRLAAAIQEADLQRTQRHRAEDDARWLMRLLSELGFDRASMPAHARAA